MQRLDLLGRRHLDEVERHAGPNLAESGQRDRQQVVLHIEHVANLERFRLALAVAAQVVHVFFRLTKQPPGAREEELTVLRQFQAFFVPPKQGDVQLLLQVLDLASERGLREVQQLGRLRDASLVGDGDKVAQVPEFHRMGGKSGPGISRAERTSNFRACRLVLTSAQVFGKTRTRLAPGCKDGPHPSWVRSIIVKSYEYAANKISASGQPAAGAEAKSWLQKRSVAPSG